MDCTDISKKCSFVDKIAFVPESFKYSEEVCETPVIPRLIHLIWVGDAPMPDTFLPYVESWHALMPDWHVHVWTNEDITTKQFPEKAVNLINSAEKGAQKADIMRYFIIERYGGVYVDADIVPNKSLEPLLNSFESSKLIVCHDIPLTWNYVINAFFAAAPHHPVLKTACDMCYDTILNTEDIHLKTGPFLLGHAINNTPTDTNEKHILLPTNMFYRNANNSERFGQHMYAKNW